MTNETARILQAQAAWAVARIVHYTLFRISLIFTCCLYSQISKTYLAQFSGEICFSSTLNKKDFIGSISPKKWTNRQMWLNTGDAAKLVNTKGEVVSELE